MDSVSTYSTASLAWLSTQALPLIIWPSLISTLLRADGPTRYAATDPSLEQYFARSLGLAQLALGLLLLVLSGALPLNAIADTPSTTDSPPPYANAAVLVTALHHAATAFYTYARYFSTGQIAYVFGCLGSSALAVAGLWVLLFAGEGGRRVSRRTGADKATSGWPFKNAEAEKKRR
ncbi:hypothetical protein BT67DRAFT_463801 [Trichocladium antarcticum]|uniref:Uncharacterized protein n=1 Tax=Trichocladium antarcticum TaxID=1450529 RepID=A0AAN6ZCJ0_9PEZI|nr:hypothetical protein BT67DRAFT_463801 [Trichocladium antarcticum]